MNRRTFFIASITAGAVSPAMSRVLAQDAPVLEARWDDTSGIYGNAWDLLPTADEGTVELLGLSYIQDHSYGLVYMLGVIHNNTDNPMVLWEVLDDDGEEYFPDSPVDMGVPPRSYALFGVTELSQYFDEENPPTVSIEYKTWDEVLEFIGMTMEEIEAMPDSRPSWYHMQIDAVEPLDDGEGHRVTITNTSDDDIESEGMALWYTIIFFDEHGVPLRGDSLDAASLDVPIPAGGTITGDISRLFRYSPEPDTPYLVTMWVDRL